LQQQQDTLASLHKALSNRKISVTASRSRRKRGDGETGCGRLLHAGLGVVWTGTWCGGGSNPVLGEKGMVWQGVKASLQSGE